LPDGDIDLTAFCDHQYEDNVIEDTLHILKREENDEDAQFQVKEVKWIRAKVRASSFSFSFFTYNVSMLTSFTSMQYYK